MISIFPAKLTDALLLAEIGRISFIESHGSSASIEITEKYVSEKYNNDVFKADLLDPNNIYHIIYYQDHPAGYSKIIFNASHPTIKLTNVTKLERLYLLKEYYSLKIGEALLNLNIELSKNNNQNGMWLFVWKENKRAVNFYIKSGFKIIGSYDFKLSESHSNPNHQMLLEY